MCLSIASSTSSSIGDPSKGREDAGRGRGGESSPVGKGMGERKRDDVIKRISLTPLHIHNRELTRAYAYLGNKAYLCDQMRPLIIR